MSTSIGGKDYKPQSLAKTLDDFKRLGKGLLVGETADILGLPADLLGLYYDVRYGQTPQGIQSLIDTIGSEALAKRFMGEEFPEFSFENFGKDENLESAGRLLAPGALLTKAIASARLAARLKKPPEGGIGSFGDQQLALAGAGAGKVPMGTGEQLLMTRADDGSGAITPTPMPKQARRMDDDAFLKPETEIKKGSVLSKDGEIFSNLLNEIEKIGTGDSQLSRTELQGVGQPQMESFVTDKGKRASRPKLDAQGNKIFTSTKEVTTGINFADNPTGEEILLTFLTLPGKKNNRLYKEAKEVGLIRYLELNRDEVFSKESGQSKLYNIASQFSPEITAKTYKATDKAKIQAELVALEAQKTNATTSIEQQRIQDLISEKNLESRLTNNAMNNITPQRIDPGPGIDNGDGTFGTVATDNVHLIFGRGERGNSLIGADEIKLDGLDPPEVRSNLKTLENFLKDAGDTDNINQLKNSYTDHGYGAIKGYDGHARMFDTFGSVDGTNLEPSRVIHELQFNSARFKANELRSASETANINLKISQLRQRLNEPGLSNDEKQLIIDQITALRKQVDVKGIVLNEDLMSVQQALKIDKQKGGKLSDFRTRRDELRKKASDLDDEIKALEKNRYDLNRNLSVVKRKGFALDEDLIKNTTTFENYRNNQDYLNRWFDDKNSILSVVEDKKAQVFSDTTAAEQKGTKLLFDNLDMQRISGAEDRPYEAIDPFFESPEMLDLEGVKMPLSIARFLGSSSLDQNFDPLRVKTFYAKNTPVKTDRKTGQTAFRFRDINDEFVTKSNQNMKIRGDSSNNPFLDFMQSGKTGFLVNEDMIKDHFKTLENLIKTGKFDPESFNLNKPLSETQDFFDERMAGKKHRFEMFNNNRIEYGDYVKAKILDDPLYFTKGENAKKFFKDALKNYGDTLERNVLRDRITMNIIQDEEFLKNIGKQNIQDYKARLSDIEKRARGDSIETNPAFNDEVKKVYEDFLTDAEIEFNDVGTKLEDIQPVGKGADIIKRIVNQTVDDHLKKYNSIPVAEYTGTRATSMPDAFNRERKSSTSRRNIVDLTFTPVKRPFGLGFGKGNLEVAYQNISVKDRENFVRGGGFRNQFQVFSNDNNPILQRLAKQEEYDALKKEDLQLTNVIKNKQVEYDKIKQELRPLEQRNAIVNIINQYGDAMPDEVKEALTKIIPHAEGRKQLAMNPSFQNTNQAIELAVNSIVKQAIKDGKKFVVFPKLRDYQHPRGGGGKTGLNFNSSAGDPLTNILKKNFGNGYFTSDEFFGTRIPTMGGARGVQAQRIGSRPGRDMNNQPVRDLPGDIDKTKFRIIDLTKINSDFKIPRFAKGGILSKFRKVA